MNLDDILNMNKGEFGGGHFISFVDSKGIDNVTKEDLDKILTKFGFDVFYIKNFPELYMMKAADKTNKVMSFWTRAVGVMTAVILLLTVLMYVQS